MSYGVNEEQDYPQMTAVVRALIAINVAVAFLQLTVLPASTFTTLGFQISDVRSDWWSPLTYMFVHAGFLHLAFNMYTLWIFGRRLEHLWGAGQFTRFYLWCGLGGLLAHALVASQTGVLIGASGAIMGVMFAYAVHWPDEEVFLFGILPMKVKVLVGLFVMLNLVAGIMSMGGTGGGIAYFAHLGGIAFGFLYMRMPSAGLDRMRHRVSSAPDENDDLPRAVPRSLPRSRERMSEIDEIVAKSNAALARGNTTVMPPRKTEGHDSTTSAVNIVLEKISERGLDSLTPAEKKLLEDASRELRRGS